MGFLCGPVNFFASILQASIDLAFFLLGFLGVQAPPSVSNALGSLFGCNV